MGKIQLAQKGDSIDSLSSREDSPKRIRPDAVTIFFVHAKVAVVVKTRIQILVS